MDIKSAEKKLHLYGDYPDKNYGYQIGLVDRDIWIDTKVKITETDDGYLTIGLDSIFNSSIGASSRNMRTNKYDKEDEIFANNLSKEDIEKLFEAQVKEQANRWCAEV